MKVNKETDIAKLAFQIAYRLDLDKTNVIEVLGMGSCMIKVVRTVELLKRVLFGLHVSVDIVDIVTEQTYEPLY